MRQAIKTERRGAVLEITVDRPPANAFDEPTTQEIHDVFVELRDDDDLKVGLVTGAGERIFSAGWDLKAVAAGDEPTIADNPDPTAFLPEIFDLYKPVIAAVNGYAVGGGFELALGCDLIIAADHAEFFLPEMQRGLLPDGGAVQMLWRRIPYYVFMDMMLTGRRLGAQEAQRWGLVRDVVPLAELMPHARAVADEIAEGAPLALQALKEYVRAVDAVSVREAFAMSRQAWAGKGDLHFVKRTYRSEDMEEGINAFAEKRKPVWKGR